MALQVSEGDNALDHPLAVLDSADALPGTIANRAVTTVIHDADHSAGGGDAVLIPGPSVLYRVAREAEQRLLGRLAGSLEQALRRRERGAWSTPAYDLETASRSELSAVRRLFPAGRTSGDRESSGERLPPEAGGQMHELPKEPEAEVAGLEEISRTIGTIEQRAAGDLLDGADRDALAQCRAELDTHLKRASGGPAALLAADLVGRSLVLALHGLTGAFTPPRSRRSSEGPAPLEAPAQSRASVTTPSPASAPVQSDGLPPLWPPPGDFGGLILAVSPQAQSSPSNAVAAGELRAVQYGRPRDERESTISAPPGESPGEPPPALGLLEPTRGTEPIEGLVGGDAQPTRTASESPPSWALVASHAMRAMGVLLILFVAFALLGSALLEGRAQRSMSAATHLRVTNVDSGLDALVLESDSTSALRKGPGLVPGSGTPGTTEPIVIVAHRVVAGGPFRHITALHPGSSIVLRAAGGDTFTYLVERTVTASPGAVIIASPGSQALVLVSAAPLYQASRRFVVVARLSGGVTSAAPTAIHLPGLRGSPIDLAGGVAVLIGLAALWGLRARWTRRLPLWLRVATWVPAAALAYLSWQLLLGSMSRLI